MTTYNSEDWLRKVLTGFSVQTEMDFEIIVADDGSTIETKKVVDSFASKFSNKFNFVKEDIHGSSIADTLNFDTVPAIFIMQPKTQKATRISDDCAWDSGCFTKTLQNY